MSNVIFRLIIFGLFLNISIGIMLTAIPEFATGSTDTTISGEGGLTYKINDSGQFSTVMGDQVSPGGEMENKADAIDRLLDTIGIGYFKRLLEAIGTYLYGFTVFLDNMVGGYLPAALRSLLFSKPLGLFYSITTIGYVIGGFSLWTGRGIRTVR